MRARRDPLLVWAVVLLLALQVVHTLDHLLRQSAPVPRELRPVAILGFTLTSLVLFLVLRSDWRASAAVAALGFAVGLGFLAIHVAPDWGPFSQPYGDIDVDGLSWAAMLVPAAAAFAVGLMGLRAARRPRSVTFSRTA